MYLRSDIAHNERNDLRWEDLETVWAEILMPKSKPILTGTCYQPPKQKNIYELLEQSCIASDSFMETESILIGDFNTNRL